MTIWNRMGLVIMLLGLDLAHRGHEVSALAVVIGALALIYTWPVREGR